MNVVNYLLTEKKKYNQLLSTIYFLFGDFPYTSYLSIPKKDFEAEVLNLILRILQDIEEKKYRKNKETARQKNKSNQTIDKEIDREFNKAFSYNENTRRNFKYIPISKRKDPYEDFLSNWKENLKYFNVSILNQLPPDVLFKIINDLQKENKTLNDKINSLIKSSESKKTLEQHIDDTSKSISKGDSNKINKEKYKENFDLLYQKLRQACIDLINLQETGEIIYD